MSYRYSENALVQQQALDLLKNELGWEVARAYNDETFGPTGTFGRTSQRDIILSRYLRKAVKRINPWINDAQIDEALATLTQSLSTNSTVADLTKKNTVCFCRRTLRFPSKIEKAVRQPKRFCFLIFNAPKTTIFWRLKSCGFRETFTCGALTSWVSSTVFRCFL